MSVSVQFPQTMLLGVLKGNLRVVKPIRVTLTREDGGIVATADDLNEWGFGENSNEAIADLREQLYLTYFELREAHNLLGAELRGMFATFREHVREGRDG